MKTTLPPLPAPPTAAAREPQSPGPDELAPRLVTLCDGRHGLRGGLAVEIREPDAPDAGAAPGAATLEFIASDETLDRYGEILSADGWRLEAYRRNPVFQNAHQYGDILFTLGKALVTEVRAGRLFQRVEFATGVNPMARIAYGLYRGKFLNAVSVGFIPRRWENGSAEAGYRRKFVEQELLEVSAVGIPANPNALQLGLRAGAVHRDDLRELLDLLRRLAPAAAPGPQPDFCSHPAASRPHACAPGARRNGAQLLQLARELQRLLRRA